MFQDQLDPISGPGRTVPDGSVSLANVQARLDDSTVLLEFWATPARIAAIWVTRDAFGIVPRRLSPEERQLLSSFSQNVATGSEKDWQSDSRALGEFLLSAIEPLGRSHLRHLLLIPDGILQSVPFELLRMGAGEQALLVERFDVSYLPSAAVLLRDAHPGGSSWNWPWQRRMVAFGDPIVRNRPNEILPVGETRAQLPKSAEEVQAIAQMTPGRAEIYLGAADLKQHLLQGRATGVPLLHLSSHATADDDNPERSRILFSPATDDEAADYLFLKEIYTLDLRDVQLTTLSACDTERGKLVKGEGVQGFSRALLSAGSQTAVTTLWRVEDHATAELMKQFYFELSRGTPKAEALRLAKLKFLRSGTALAEPRHWAAFVLNGDGREPLSRVISWATLLAPLAGALLLGGLFARRWL
jgi:CHAT domain-containing protein